VGTRLYKQDAVFAEDKQVVMHLLDSCLQPFEQLYKQHKMSKPFYAYAKSLINNYYGSVLASVTMQPILKAVYNKDSAGYNEAALRQLDDQVQEAIKMIDIADPATFTTDTYQEYLMFYQKMYVGYHLPLMRGKTLKDGKGKRVFYGIEEDITKEPAREYCLAFTLQSLILEKQFERYIPDLYKEFVGRYPHSRYIKLLTAGIEKVKDFNAATKKELTFDERFIPHYDSIATVEELLSKFKNKTIYIDMWATWCGPCKEQFEFKKDIDPFLKSKGVDVLYLSIDKASDKQKWINMIKYYNLDGYHVMASEQLNNDIRKVFGRNKVLYIPKYMICKDGKVIVKNARKPQEKDALFKQIESVL
jgi:thiol-disulfide isomerase/thioredoxin